MARLLMSPAPGERLLRFVGDRMELSLRDVEGQAAPPGWRACLRTNLGRAAARRAEIIAAVQTQRPVTHASWRDLPLRWQEGAWRVNLVLHEVGYFRGKAYAIDPQGRQHWPDGPDAGINVQPNHHRTGNTIYCAFTRQFGATKPAVSTANPLFEHQLKSLDQQDYTVIPPSGKFRDLIRELPHIFQELGCRILHLLPVQPTPTTYGRLGRFGSPYACQDLTAIDPALVEFDRRTTGTEQFEELAYEVHNLGGRLFLDIVINHTGWGAALLETHPEWFKRRKDGAFASPGAWGTIWEDLVELDHAHPELRELVAEAFLAWCRRGVDGFRCDAGYKVPLPVWQYVTARVREEFPETVFLLEGLGGAWEATEELLTEGGMQWAYSELFQNYTGPQVAGYLEHALAQSQRTGLLVHYSETHDNERLAPKGRVWSLLRNRLCALTSVSGGFGFTCGVEWLATERINVHSSRGLNWGGDENLVRELGRLNRLLDSHPCFFDGARLTRLSAPESPVYALLRASAQGADQVLVLINTDTERAQGTSLDPGLLAGAGLPITPGTTGGGLVELLQQPLPRIEWAAGGRVWLSLAAGEALCLAAQEKPRGLSGEEYRRHKAQEALAFEALARLLPLEHIGPVAPCLLAEWVDRDLAGYLSALTYLDPAQRHEDLAAALQAAGGGYPRAVIWRLEDRTRVLPVPPQHWLVLLVQAPFRAELHLKDSTEPLRVASIAVRDGFAACFAPQERFGEAELRLERYRVTDQRVRATVRFLGPGPLLRRFVVAQRPPETVLLTNGLGGMARIGVDLGAVRSKYDCLLGANLHPRVPVDRHIFAKRLRAWVTADGFFSPLNADNLLGFEPGPPAQWRFVAHAGDGRVAEIHLLAEMLKHRNALVLRFQRPAGAPAVGKDLPQSCDVRLSVRVDIEDRNFHWETKRTAEAEHHFEVNCRPLPDRPGFAFTPASERQLRVWGSTGRYHHEPEWCNDIPHPLERSRGQISTGDAYSPGWFELDLPKGGQATLVVCADPTEPSAEQTQALELDTVFVEGDPFSQHLLKATQAFLARREDGVTMIAGYPWFLDWGRDTLICARGLLAAGWVHEVEQLVLLFGRFERQGTLPNAIYGEDASNRDTSDAPLWYGMVCEELAAHPMTHQPAALYATPVDRSGRTLADVLRSIAEGYLLGTPNGIRVDPLSGLVWSPAHFTWMDTDHPAATPRQGYPVCIQALWIRLLRQLERLGLPPATEPWGALARRAQAAFEELFWFDDRGYFADVLLAQADQPAAAAERDTALRSNCLFPISLGLVTGLRARRCVAAALRYLLVPGAVRSLAPLPVWPPLPIRGLDGHLVNNPDEPYWGRYEGDEDTRRKPAYHNGTAWTWTLPTLCEALARAWDFSPSAVAAARAYLGSVDGLLTEGCLGHIPEVLDGDAPHRQRGCDAQAWSVTEALRVWRLLRSAAPDSRPSTPAP